MEIIINCECGKTIKKAVKEMDEDQKIKYSDALTGSTVSSAHDRYAAGCEFYNVSNVEFLQC